VRCVTRNEPNQSIVVDLHGLLVRPTHYALRHYASWVRCVLCGDDVSGMSWSNLMCQSLVFCAGAGGAKFSHSI
jgi:hypothetical protein